MGLGIVSIATFQAQERDLMFLASVYFMHVSAKEIRLRYSSLVIKKKGDKLEMEYDKFVYEKMESRNPIDLIYYGNEWLRQMYLVLQNEGINYRFYLDDYKVFCK